MTDPPLVGPSNTRLQVRASECEAAIMRFDRVIILTDDHNCISRGHHHAFKIMNLMQCDQLFAWRFKLLKWLRTAYFSLTQWRKSVEQEPNDHTCNY